MRCGLLAVLILVLNALAQVAAADPSQVISAGCRMGTCAWFRILETEIVKSNNVGTLIRSKEAHGESEHPDDNYERKTPIKWSEPTNQYVFCSKLKPAVIFHIPPSDYATCRYGCWYAHLLSPGYADGVYGYNASDYEAYFRICHGLAKIDPQDISLARKFGYARSLIKQVGQVEIKSPEDIFGH